MHDESTDATDESALAYEPPRWVVTPAADIAALALRMLGVKVAVDLLVELSAYASFLATSGQPGVITWNAVAISVVARTTIAALLIFAARPLGEAIFGRRTVLTHDLGVGAWMTLIVSGVGLALALFSLDDASRAAAVTFARIQTNVARRSPRAIEAGELVALAAPILKTGLGVLLFFRPSLLVTPWLRGVHRETITSADAGGGEAGR